MSIIQAIISSGNTSANIGMPSKNIKYKNFSYIKSILNRIDGLSHLMYQRTGRNGAATLSNRALISNSVVPNDDLGYVVEVIDSSLTHSTIEYDKTYKFNVIGSNSSYAMVTSGTLRNEPKQVYTDVVNVFNTSLQRVNPITLSARKLDVTPISSEILVLFAGGSFQDDDGTYYTGGSDSVDCINNNLTKLTPLTMSSNRRESAGVLFNYVFLITYDNGIAGSIDLFHSIYFTKGNPITGLMIRTSCPGFATTSTHAILGGSYTLKGEVIGDLEVFNSSLTKLSPLRLQTNLASPTTISTDNYAIFAGGDISMGEQSDEINIFDKSLVRHNDSLIQRRANSSATKIDNTLIFAGGYYYDEELSNHYCDNIDIFTIIQEG